jgi:hypothetical protein
MDDGARRAMDAWFEEACRPGFWAALNPDLKLDTEQVGPLFEVDDVRRAELWNDLLTNGYFEGMCELGGFSNGVGVTSTTSRACRRNSSMSRR